MRIGLLKRIFLSNFIIWSLLDNIKIRQPIGCPMFRKDDGRAIAKCLFSHRKNCLVNSKDPQDIEKLFDKVLLENPGIFDVTRFEYTIYGEKTVISPDYKMSGWAHMKMRRKVSAAIESLVLRTRRDTAYDTLLALHDALLGVKYRSDEHSHTIVGPLLYGYGVCEGISKTVLQICNSNDIECRIVCGRSMDGIPHCWNQVMVGHEWYNMDMTWDIQNSDKDIGCYDYFLVDDTVIERDHVYEKDDIVCTDGRYDRYRSTGMECPTVSDIGTIIGGDRNGDEFSFRTVAYSELSDVEEVLHSIYPSKYIKIIWNRQQNTFHVRLFDNNN